MVGVRVAAVNAAAEAATAVPTFATKPTPSNAPMARPRPVWKPGQMAAPLAVNATPNAQVNALRAVGAGTGASVPLAHPKQAKHKPL